MEIGQVYNVQPVPPDPARTYYFDVAPLRVGVEYRELDPETLASLYEGEDLAEIEEHSPEGGFTDEGLSIHVFSIEDEHEYIRFDAFDDDPHYHYVDKSAGTNTVVPYDLAAHGEVVPWVLKQISGRLDSMLRRAGAPHVADRLGADVGTQISDQLSVYLPTIGIEVGVSQ